MEAIAAIMGPAYLAIGLSVLLYAKQWQKLMGKWEKDHFTLFPLMFMMVILGLIVVNMHNVWEWDVSVLVTLVGWGMLLKGLFYMLLPGSVLQWSLRLGQTTGLLYVGGVVGVVVGGVLGYYAYLV